MFLEQIKIGRCSEVALLPDCEPELDYPFGMPEFVSHRNVLDQGTTKLLQSRQQRNEGADLGTVHSHAQFCNDALQEKIITNGGKLLPTDATYKLNDQIQHCEFVVTTPIGMKIFKGSAPPESAFGLIFVYVSPGQFKIILSGANLELWKIGFQDNSAGEILMFFGVLSLMTTFKFPKDEIIGFPDEWKTTFRVRALLRSCQTLNSRI